MTKKDKKTLTLIVLTVTALAIILFVANFFLSHRLEKFLKKELVERTAKATDGFYLLSFDNLYIGLLTGELRLEGVKLIPDSVVYKEWAVKDSLPPVYLEMNIDLIDFKGVNLVWRWNNRALHFSTFEIKSPIVNVYHSEHSLRMEHMPKHTQAKTLYEMVSPYITELTVRTMNLEHASVAYTIQDKEAPITYALDDVTFHAYGFRLDENSSTSGKLLYCDDFDFTTNQAQTLLTNNDFVLATDSITLNTQEAIIHIGNIHLASQETLWEKRGKRPQNALEGNIESVDVKGLQFKRINSRNYLEAGSFDIHHSDIKGYNLSGETKKPVTDVEKNWIHADSLIKAMSLYEITSPILHNISIERIGVNKARMHYTIAAKDSFDVYMLDNFDFEARGFVIDSITSLMGESKYYKYMSFDATGIQGNITSRNQSVAIKRLAMDTEKERLHMEAFHINHIRPDNLRHTLSGKMDTVSLEGVDYRDGVKARRFSIAGMNLDYYKSTDTVISLQMPRLLLEGLSYQTNNRIQTASFHMEYPDIRMVKNSKPEQEFRVGLGNLDVKNFTWDSNGYNFGWIDTQMNNLYSMKDGHLFERPKDTTHLTVTGLFLDKDFRSYHLDEIDFSTSNLSIPVDNGFFTLNIEHLILKNRNLSLDGLSFVSTYPKMEFAYKHPKHSDWFDIRVGHLGLKGIDMGAFTKNNILRMEEAVVTDMVLRNFRNQKIPLPRKVVPMIYEGLQKAPVKIDIPVLHVNNFAVEYDELARNGETPGKLVISDVNGTITGLTNIVSSPEQFIRIDASARFMRTGAFSAVWMLPVDSLHDQFLVHAHLEKFNLADLNEFIKPLANIEIESGVAQDVAFDMDASSKEGHIRMRLPYRDLKIEVLKRKEDESEKNSFTTFLANTVVRNNNPPHPEKPDSKLRESEMTITRDPHHSTFNYLWQLLRPPMAEAIGVSEGTQKFGKGVMKVISGIKNFFTGNKHKEEEQKTEK